MEQKGKLVRWVDDRGFGFIKPEIGDQEVFIHIKTLSKMARRPVVGDVIYFMSMTDEKGKEKAYSGRIDGVEVISSLSPPPPVQMAKRKPQTRGSNKRSSNIVFIIIITAALYGYSRFMDKPIPQQAPQQAPPVVTQVPATHNSSGPKTPSVSESLTHSLPVVNQFEDDSGFRCEGKQHCSQMTSCKEARFYLRNCPGVKIDGDNDGIPCEKQCSR